MPSSEKTYTLSRLDKNDRRIMGVLTNSDETVLCHTLERPWLGNTAGMSCIPPGTYGVINHDGPRFKNVWELTGVPGRSAILIHPGNTVADTRGCILVGMKKEKNRILDSLKAVQFLRKELPPAFTLVIEG